jgi:hypothetical protein
MKYCEKSLLTAQKCCSRERHGIEDVRNIALRKNGLFRFMFLDIRRDKTSSHKCVEARKPLDFSIDPRE